MDWIFENLQFLIAVGAGIAYWINKVREDREARRMEDDENTEATDWDYEAYDPEPEEEEPEMIPVPAPMPRIVIHQRIPPPLPPQADPVADRQREMMERLKTLRAERAAAAQKGAPRTTRTTASSGNAGLRSRLRDKNEIRRAIVLREILGPPAGLR